MIHGTCSLEDHQVEVRGFIIYRGPINRHAFILHTHGIVYCTWAMGGVDQNDYTSLCFSWMLSFGREGGGGGGGGQGG
jgi:hypothetical protein